MDMLPHALTAIFSNQVFAGVTGGAVVSGALFQLRSAPGRMMGLFQSWYSVTVSVHSDQEAFRNLDLWIARHPSSKRSRRLTLAEWWDPVLSKTVSEMTPGDGSHLIWDGWRPIFISRMSTGGADGGGNAEAPVPQAGGGNSGSRKQTLAITTLGRSRTRITQLLGEAVTIQERHAVPVYVWRGHGYELVERRPRRALESVILAAGLQGQIVDDARRFIDRREWYAERGIPHRRGYLFEGPPGTGKSSMALALAGELARSIYIINPASVMDDNSLQYALNRSGNGVVLIEDIDAIEVSRERSRPKLVDSAFQAASQLNQGGGGITMSGLLNAIDGVAARDGRILIITSNHADDLDEALVRPGRVDMRCHFGLAGEVEARAMFKRFLPESDEALFSALIAPSLPLSQAELQNRLLKMVA